MAKKQYIEELDYARALTAIGIFMIHATGGYAILSDFNSNVMHLGIFLNQIFRFGTPVFMIMAGLVLFYSYRNLQEFKALTFFKKKALFLIIPYLIWSLGYFLFKSYMYQIDITLGSVLFFLKQAMLGDAHDHLYFIFLIIQFYLLFPLMLLFMSKQMKTKPWHVLTITFALQASILVYAYYFKIPSSNWLINLLNIHYWKSIFGWFFYFIFGGLLAYHYFKVMDFINKYIKLILVGFIIVATVFIGEVYLSIVTTNGRDFYEMFGSIRPNNMIFTPFALAILLWISSRIKEMKGFVGNSIKSIGTYSLGIYFVHPMVMELIKIKLLPLYPEYLGYGRVLSLIIFLMLAWTLTISICYLISLLNWRWLLLGKVPSFKITQWFAGKAVADK